MLALRGHQHGDELASIGHLDALAFLDLVDPGRGVLAKFANSYSFHDANCSTLRATRSRVVRFDGAREYDVGAELRTGSVIRIRCDAHVSCRGLGQCLSTLGLSRACRVHKLADMSMSVGHVESESYTIAEAAERTGLSAHTLRYYERLELVSIERNQAGQRRYSDADVRRLVFVARLRSTDMPMRDIRYYFELVTAGEHTRSERLVLLQQHRDYLRKRVGELETALDAIEFKITSYGGTCEPDRLV